jgi:polar amino acid transport system substrate-binding protein
VNHHMRIHIALLACLPTLALAAGCSSSDDDGGGAGSSTSTKVAPAIEAPADIASAGQIRFCTDPTYPPAEFKEGSEYVGFDVEIAGAVASSMGVEVDFVDTGFDGIIAAVRGDKCDAVIAAMTVTPEREEVLEFAEYGRLGYGLMVPKGNPEGLRTVEDLSGHTVAVQLGSTQKDFLEEESAKLEQAGREPIEIQTFPKDTDAASALQAGRVDAYFADGAPVAYYVKRNADRFEVAATDIATDPIGIGMRKDDAELHRAVEQAIDELYETGAMDEILGRWNVEGLALR